MDPTSSLPVSPDALELRVLAGAQTGARAPLQPGVACVLAADADDPAVAADIVLREPGNAPAAVRFVPGATHALVEVLHGEVTLDGQVLAAGAQAPWPRHAPLAIGAARVAFGAAGEDEWPLADAEGRAQAEPPAETAQPLHRRAEVWLAAIGAVLVLLCAGALGIAQLAAKPAPVVKADAAALVQQLKASPFAGLQASARADGSLQIAGRLATLAQRQRLEAWLAEREAAAALDIVVDEQVAREVTEVFRINGVAVQVQSSGLGRLVAEAAEPDAAKFARAEEVVRRDVRGFESLALRNTAPVPQPPAPPLSDDPGKRIASLVPGEPAYVVTVDGSRYFVGATLPSGHRVAAVAAQRLTLELNGRQSMLNF